MVPFPPSKQVPIIQRLEYLQQLKLHTLRAQIYEPQTCIKLFCFCWMASIKSNFFILLVGDHTSAFNSISRHVY